MLYSTISAVAALLDAGVSWIASGSAQPSASNPTPAEATIRAALITACVTLVGIVLKDLVFKFIEEHRAKKTAEAAVYERYSKPLAAVASSLLVRLHEIILQRHRPVYLKSVGTPVGNGSGSEFRAYKKLSTLYRLAGPIGWLRACRREFSYVRVAARNENNRIHAAISELENALADGSWVERERVSRLADLWKLGKSNLASATLNELGILVDNGIVDSLETLQVEELSDLSEDQQLVVCRAVEQIMTSHLNTNAVNEATMRVTWPDAFRIISIREAWLYKDWQDAIGDTMLRRIENEDRKFEVLGYLDFKKLFRSADQTHNEPILRLTKIFDSLDLSIEDRFDARPRQLKRVSRATAKLIKALHSAQGHQSIFPDYVVKIADSILGTC